MNAVAFKYLLSAFSLFASDTLAFTMHMNMSPHDMFVHLSGLRRAQGTPNGALTLQDPKGPETQIRSHRVTVLTLYFSCPMCFLELFHERFLPSDIRTSSAVPGRAYQHNNTHTPTTQQHRAGPDLALVGGSDSRFDS